jgi:hypothetical protein
MTTSAPRVRTTYRCTFSLPCELAIAISRVSKHVGVSQSALLAELIGAPMADLLRLVELAPAPGDTSPESMARLRGESVSLVQRRVSEALDEAASIGQTPLFIGDLKDGLDDTPR